MLLEYCDRGSLARAIERGKLMSRAPGGGPDLVRFSESISLPTSLPPSLPCSALLSSILGAAQSEGMIQFSRSGTDDFSRLLRCVEATAVCATYGMIGGGHTQGLISR